MRFIILLAFVGPRPFCRPAIDPGPVRADLAAAPVAVVIEPTDAEDAVIVIQILAGSAFDRSGREGLAGLTSLQVAQTATDCPDLSVDVGLELVTFRATATDACSRSLTTALVTPVPLTDADRQSRAQSLLDVSDDVVPRLADQLVRETVYSAHPYGHAAAGRASVVQTTTDIELRAFHSRHYVRGTTLVTLSGVAEEASMVGAIQDSLSRLATTLPADAPRQSPIAVPQRTITVASSKTLPAGAAMGQALSVTLEDDDWSVWLDAVAVFNTRQHPSDIGTWSITTGPAVAWHTRHPMLLLSVDPATHEHTAGALIAATQALEAWVDYGVTPQELASVEAQSDTNPERVQELLQRIVSPDTLAFAIVTDRNDRFEQTGTEETSDSTVYVRLGIDEGHHHTVQAQGLYR